MGKKGNNGGKQKGKEGNEVRCRLIFERFVEDVRRWRTGPPMVVGWGRPVQ